MVMCAYLLPANLSQTFKGTLTIKLKIMNLNTKFTNKIALRIAKNQFNTTLDCILEKQDPIYGFETEIWEFEQNFEEDLSDYGINPTPARVKIISDKYIKIVEKAKIKIEKLYFK